MFVNVPYADHTIPYSSGRDNVTVADTTLEVTPPFFMHFSEGGSRGSGSGGSFQVPSGTPAHHSFATESELRYQPQSNPNSEAEAWNRFAMRGPAGGPGQGERDTYQLQEAIEAKAKWVQLPDRKATVHTMAPPDERLPGREAEKVSATEKTLQDARAGLQTLMKYQKHSKSTFRPANYNPK